jgi:hypothetical protein
MLDYTEIIVHCLKDICKDDLKAIVPLPAALNGDFIASN